MIVKMECRCGDLRPLSEMYCRLATIESPFAVAVVECVDCTVGAGADLDSASSMSHLVRGHRLSRRAERTADDGKC